MCSQNDAHDFSWPVAILAGERLLWNITKGQGHFETKQFQGLESWKAHSQTSSPSLLLLSCYHWPWIQGHCNKLHHLPCTFIPGTPSQRAGTWITVLLGEQSTNRTQERDVSDRQKLGCGEELGLRCITGWLRITSRDGSRLGGDISWLSLRNHGLCSRTVKILIWFLRQHQGQVFVLSEAADIAAAV